MPRTYFFFSECTACEVPSEWSCRTAQVFVVDFMGALPGPDSSAFPSLVGVGFFYPAGGRALTALPWVPVQQR